MRQAIPALSGHNQGTLWGDMSNMNGGNFPPHHSHQKGVDVDGDFTGYRKIDANSAAGILRFLNDPTYGPKIGCIWVTGSHSGAFWKAIQEPDDSEVWRRYSLCIIGNLGHTAPRRPLPHPFRRKLLMI